MPPSPIETAGRVVRFGLFEVDLDGNELRKRGVRLKLQDQPQSLLKILLEQPGTVITRDDLRTRLWKPGTYVEFDHSLNTAMMRLREALGDSSDNPMFIETVPRKGYRFIAPVHQVLRAPPEEPAATAAPDGPLPLHAAPSPEQPVLTPEWPIAQSTARQVPLTLALALGLAVACVTLAGVYLLRFSPWALPPARQVSSIAVLPMENLSGDANQDYFADGMTDQLIASLARISSLRVVSRTTAMDYKGTHESLEKIARDLHVDAVVEGTVLRAGDRVRITAELVQVSTDRHLWADTYESQMGDILTLQNQVATAIVSQIRIKLTPQDKETLATSRPVNSEAFEDYLKGRYYWGKRSEDALDKAIQYFEAATRNDPRYALAYAGLADCYGILGTAIVGTVPTSEVAAKAELAAQRAVQLDPTLAETQTALATVQFNVDWNWKAAEAGFQRAIQLNPSYATAHQRYSLFLMAMGRTDESLAEMNRARTLDPLSLSMNFSLGWRLYMARRYDEAIAQLLNTIEMDPAYLLAHVVLGQSYEQRGRYAQAIAELEKASTLAPESPPVVAALAHALAAAGRRAEAMQLLSNLKAQTARRYVSPFYMAYVYAGLDDRQQTLAWLEKSYEDRSNNTIFLNQVPQFDAMRSDPRFQTLRRKIGL
ncbi:MAG: winged helix-turn-helix domain-containing protein [Acidobacteriota bacterium]|nr:winged helix-turn-helix domain-containing protein [Acidobacteriota bacterium]